jgi:hypothetical protein
LFEIRKDYFDICYGGAIKKVCFAFRKSNKLMKYFTRNAFLASVFISFPGHSFAQSSDSAKIPVTFSGSVSVTDNGISIIPTFSLNKPALLVNPVLAKGRLSFEPALSFSLQGKPWQFLFWFRYKVIDHEKFKIRIGAHPSLNWVDETTTTDSISQTHRVDQHYAALEVVPNYFITDNINIGIYYLFGKGLQPDAIKTTHFVTFNANFSNIKLSKQFFLAITPQVYYLYVPSQHGFYCTANVTLNKEKMPLSFALFGNLKLKSDISGSPDFLWNAMLTYAF